MEFTVHEMIYTGELTDLSCIECIPFEKKFFPDYMKIYNDCFYEMRKALCRKPYNVISSFEQVESKTDNIFLFLNRDDEIVGSVSCDGNEIDDLIVNRKYQGKGLGKELLLWAMEKIRQKSTGPITLHVAELNNTAFSMYKKYGFEISSSERIQR